MDLDQELNRNRNALPIIQLYTINSLVYIYIYIYIIYQSERRIRTQFSLGGSTALSQCFTWLSYFNLDLDIMKF